MISEKPKPKRRGIPTTHWTQDKANAICDRLAMGESLRSICRSKGQPAKIVVLRWLRDIPEFRTQYDKARDDQADALFDEVLDIAEDGSNDWMQRQNFDGNEVGWHLNGEAVARSRLRIDTRKWMAAKLRPKKYGEKIEVDQTIGVTDALGALLGRVSEQGTRLVPMIEAPEAEDDGE
jgi:hypothetical protein